LIELHYRTAHNVSDYALMLNITPKSLNRKIVTERQIAPNVIIKNRIILQAKRMLANTQFSIKEIAFISVMKITRILFGFQIANWGFSAFFQKCNSNLCKWEKCAINSELSALTAFN
jgi:hypothetical protein